MKMYCIFSKEALAKMNGIRGKLAAQAGHAYLHSWWDASARFPKDTQAYLSSGHARKITLVVDTDAELRALEATYRKLCGVSLVVDAGFTVFDGPTVTCLGIGPISEGRVGDDLRELKTLT